MKLLWTVLAAVAAAAWPAALAFAGVNKLEMPGGQPSTGAAAIKNFHQMGRFMPANIGRLPMSPNNLHKFNRHVVSPPKFLPQLQNPGGGQEPNRMAAIYAKQKAPFTAMADNHMHTSSGVENFAAKVKNFAADELRHLKPREGDLTAGHPPTRANWSPPSNNYNAPQMLAPKSGQIVPSESPVEQETRLVEGYIRQTGQKESADVSGQPAVSRQENSVTSAAPEPTVTDASPAVDHQQQGAGGFQATQSDDAGVTVQVDAGNKTEEEGEPTGPRVLPVVSEKRNSGHFDFEKGQIHDSPEGDELFLVVVIGVAMVCILAVLGVGYCIHNPNNSPATPANSDSSPTFHTAKLAFKSPTDERQQHDTVNRGVSNRMTTDGLMSDNTLAMHNNNLVNKGKYVRPTSLYGKPSRPNHLNQQQQSNKSLGRMHSLINIEDEADEEEEDDTIYECPGLAPPGEMEVNNPFFLPGDLDSLADKSVGLFPCPVNNNNNIKHGNINVAGK